MVPPCWEKVVIWSPCSQARNRENFLFLNLPRSYVLTLIEGSIRLTILNLNLFFLPKCVRNLYIKMCSAIQHNQIEDTFRCIHIFLLGVDYIFQSRLQFCDGLVADLIFQTLSIGILQVSLFVQLRSSSCFAGGFCIYLLLHCSILGLAAGCDLVSYATANPITLCLCDCVTDCVLSIILK